MVFKESETREDHWVNVLNRLFKAEDSGAEAVENKKMEFLDDDYLRLVYYII